MYPPLSRSEWLVLDFLDRHLPEKWEIYVQPALNGMRPDFVLLHDEFGVGVVEVKHWRINSGRFTRHALGIEGTHVLRYRFGGREIDMARSNPIEQIDRYRQGILDLYCPRLGKRGVQVVFGAVIFTDTPKEAAQYLLEPWILRATRSSYPRNCVISGSAELQSREIMKCIPWAWKSTHASKEQVFNPDMAADVRTWLEEPDSARESRRPLRFSTPQQEVITRLTRRIRVRGAAGSGKSFVLVARAARLAGEGKRVLVLTFNLTLIAYIRQLCFRIPDAPTNFYNKVTWLSFHLWIRRMCEDAGAIDEYRAVWAKHNAVPS
ncbi:MAG: NERD domain-containing protein/DEAD/DEAH box helicase [Opitutaceae bacterium]|nr:NERD domain-containing protein/DEAD/DEAH box helicase [Opitutaceae bacterium]